MANSYLLNLLEIVFELKQLCFLDTDCLVVGESQCGSPPGIPVKPPQPEGDSQTFDTYHCRKNFDNFFTNQIFC